MNKDLKEIYKDFPEAISASIIMTEANSDLLIYEGEYSIKNKTGEIKLYGKIIFEWFANSGVYFYGNLIADTEVLFNSDKYNETYSVIVNGLEFGQGFITKFVIGNFAETSIKGVISQHAILGDKSISVNKIKFLIPNLREFQGENVKRISEKSISTSMDRLVLEDDTYIITIDKCSDFKKRKDKLEDKGGFIALYNGELSIKKGHLTHTDTEELFHCFNTFITFLNGRRTSALFIQGVFEDQILWTDYTDYYVDTFKAVQTWPQKYTIAGLNELWMKFQSIWHNNSEDKNFLTSLIHWYVEANGQSGFSEGSIILAQTALELVYNWWIVEKKKMIIGKDSENISASNKIRLLISQLNLLSNIPVALIELQQFKDSTDNVYDAPDSIVYIRNAIVHSQEDKRRKLSSINEKAKYEALQIYLLYIELSLLCILDFNGQFNNRCSNEIYSARSEQQVPWKKR